MPKLISFSKNITKSEVFELHAALKRLQFNIPEAEVLNKSINTGTEDSIKLFQQNHNLEVNGKLNEETVKAINAELVDVYYTEDKTRTKKLHMLLEKLNPAVDREEKKKCITGSTTRQAIKQFQAQAGIPVDGRVSEVLIDKLIIRKTYSSKRQIDKLHNLILYTAKIAKLDIQISAEELKNKAAGETTVNALKAFQKKYRLHQTGVLDKDTLDKMQSVAVSRGTGNKVLNKPQAWEISAITKNLRLNMTSSQVADLQKALAYL